MMNPCAALITAARRYCRQESDYWVERYARERTGTDHPYTYTDNDYNLFPRYNVLGAILGAVEGLVDRSGEDLAHCREELKRIGRQAQSLLTSGETHPVEAKAMAEEREKFARFIDAISPEELKAVAPLPYRRRLREEEREWLRGRLYEHWNFGGDYWNPLEELSPEPVLFLRKHHLTEADEKAITDAVRACAEDRLYEVTEDGSDAQIEFALFHTDPYETIFCDASFRWIVYGSHEGTITFGGTDLLPLVRAIFAGREVFLNNWE